MNHDQHEWPLEKIGKLEGLLAYAISQGAAAARNLQDDKKVEVANELHDLINAYAHT